MFARTLIIFACYNYRKLPACNWSNTNSHTLPFTLTLSTLTLSLSFSHSHSLFFTISWPLKVRIKMGSQVSRHSASNLCHLPIFVIMFKIIFLLTTFVASLHSLQPNDQCVRISKTAICLKFYEKEDVAECLEGIAPYYNKVKKLIIADKEWISGHYLSTIILVINNQIINNH